MVFHTKGRDFSTQVDVTICHKIINQVSYVKFLGVTIDSTLSWSEHIRITKTKIAKGIGMLVKARKFLCKSTLTTIYNSFIYPYLLYGIEVWGRANRCHIDSLFKMQKKAIRIIASANYRAHTEPLFLSLQILPLHKIYIFAVSKLMYRYSNRCLPPMFNEMFLSNHQVHSHMTRHCQKIHVPLCRTAMLQRTFRYKGAIIWNHISRHVTHNCSIATYKHNLKQFVLNNDLSSI